MTSHSHLAASQEFCLMISSCNNADTSIGETYRRSFFHIASRDDPSSEHYHRDLAFLMHCSVKMSEFGLALSLGEAVMSVRWTLRTQI